jgi:hypothetical protein
MPEQEPVVSEPVEDRDEWLEEAEELPRRPRRRLLGVGANPVPLALLGVLLTACGFIGGVLVEKGETSPSTSAGSAAAGLASRFRALRGGASGTSSSSAGGSSGLGAGFTRPTAGTVAYLAGNTLYVTNAEGNTVKVSTSAGTSVTKTVKSSVAAVHPGETVTIVGPTGNGGSVSAESISVGGGGGALASLFGGGGSGGASTGAGSPGSSGSKGASEPALFGNGG